jgi:hypothetical protein
MDNEFSNMEQSLEKISLHRMEDFERERAWHTIVTKHNEQPIVSPYSWMLFVHSRVAVTVAALLIIVLGGAGTVAAADDSKPGDALYAVDRAAESVRLALTPQSEKASVQLAFADERLTELDEIISEETPNRGVRGPSMAAQRAPVAETMALKVAVTEDTSASGAEGEGNASATLMMAAEAPAAQESELSDESVAKISEGIENAIANLEDISVSLEEKGNVQAQESVVVAADRLEERLGELPIVDQEKFRLRLDELRDRGNHGEGNSVEEESDDIATTSSVDDRGRDTKDDSLETENPDDSTSVVNVKLVPTLIQSE